MDRLDDELGGIELLILYGSAELLDINTVENLMSERRIRRHADELRELIRRLEAMLSE